MFKANKEDLTKLVGVAEMIFNLEKEFNSLKLRHTEEILNGRRYFEETAFLLREMKDKGRRPKKVRTLALCTYLMDYGQNMYDVVATVPGMEEKFKDSGIVIERDKFITDCIKFIELNY